MSAGPEAYEFQQGPQTIGGGGGRGKKRSKKCTGRTAWRMKFLCLQILCLTDG